MITKILKLFTLPALLILLLSNSVHAQNNIQQNEVVTLAPNQTINEDYFAWGERVVVSGTINGDAYIGGGNVIVDGTINGDLIVGGGSVNILGKVTGDTRAGGGQVIFSGETDGNLTTAGGSIEITDSAIIGGSLTAGTGSLSVFAPIGKGATIGAGSVVLADQIAGNVNAAVGDLTLTPSAKVNGNLTYVSSNEAQIQQGAQVSGKTTHNLPKEKQKEAPEDAARIFAGANIVLKAFSFLAALIVGLLLLKLAPSYSQKVSDKIQKHPFTALGVGLLTLILFPIVFVLTFITVVGIPLAGISLAIFLIELYLAKIFVAFAVGQRVTKDSSTYLQFTAGLLIYMVLTILPVLGFIVSILALLAGLGAIVISKKELYNQLSGKKLI